MSELFANRASTSRIDVSTAIVSQVDNGVQCWSLSIALDGVAEILSATTDGTAGAIEPAGLRCGVSFEVTEVVDPSRNDGQKGVVSAVVLGFLGCLNVLDPAGTARSSK